MKIVAEFETVQCNVRVVEMAWCFNDEHVFAIISTHKKSGESLTRFGNVEQTRQIVSTYRKVGGKKTVFNWD